MTEEHQIIRLIDDFVIIYICYLQLSIEGLHSRSGGNVVCETQESGEVAWILH